MAQKLYRFTGPVRWAKLYDHNMDTKFPGNENNSIDIKVNEDAYKATGLSAGPSKDGEGYYTFRRKPASLVWRGKEQVPAGHPVVIDADGNPFTGLIGNGSVCTIEVTVYDYDNKFGKGKSHRLEGVRVDELVEYTPDQDSIFGVKF